MAAGATGLRIPGHEVVQATFGEDEDERRMAQDLSEARIVEKASPSPSSRSANPMAR